jgi:hypothetical protein
MATLAFAEAFARYGATLKNVQWSVCAQAPDGSLVVSLWEHHFDPPRDGKIVCADSFNRWAGPGNAEFRKSVVRALNSNQVVRAVIAHAKNPALIEAGADGSKIEKSFSVREDWTGRVLYIEGERYAFEFQRTKGAT